uniref:Uncharacterized protein n=1 Tax=uncultured bacterium contig00068 TaxID=1181549 RepID=A0A806K207_9BACT|nr:hypothetical protein [uncultured bacterium contig00068]
MQITLKGKFFLLLLAVCVVFSAVSLEITIIKDMHHNCSGHGCKICLKIQNAILLLQTIKLICGAFVLAAIFMRAVRVYNKKIEIIVNQFSLVTLKVRSNS